MKCCIDVQAAVSQGAGVGRYTRLLVEHLDRLGGDDEFVLAYFDFHRRGLSFSPSRARAKAIRWCPGAAAQAAWKYLHWPPYDWFAGPADLYHFPNFLIPPIRRGPSVVTIHDMSFFRFPQFTEQRNLDHLSARIRRTASRADAIITDSEFSAREITELLHVPAARVFPIPLGISPNFRRPAPEDVRAGLARLGIDSPYLLTVGTVEPRKNIAFLVDVFERLSRYDGNLVIAGALGWKYGAILERIARSPVSARIRLLNYVPDTSLPALYAGADAFLIASHYEGFGFPPLESMACGTPVVSSGGGSLREVLGNAALEPEALEAGLWAETITGLLDAPSRREVLVTGGIAQSSRYRWERTAAETLSVYRKLAGTACMS